MTLTSKTFRIFVSSTFSDLKEERNALQQHVFPKLRDLCMQHGCRFQAIDLRWGVSEEASRDQQTLKICLEEIKRCQRVTPRPNFIVVLGDRYGWRPLPAEIPASEFEHIKQRISSNSDDESSDRAALEQWYKRDDNALYRAQENAESQSVYCLQPRGEKYADYDSWKGIETRLCSILEQATVDFTFETEDGRAKYTASATEQEVVLGALSVPDANEHVYCFFRSIKTARNLPIAEDLPQDAATKDFVDAAGAPGACDRIILDSISHCRLHDLKQRLRARVPHNIQTYEARWKGDPAGTCDTGGLTSPISTDDIGTLPESLDECLKLIDEPAGWSGLCVDVWRRLASVIRDQVQQLESLKPEAKEERGHENFGRDRARLFTGRASYLKAIAEYIKGEGTQPLVIWGESGSGKSALMAHAAEQASDERPGAEILVRFIGSTPGSSDGRALLEGLCREISRRYNASQADIPSDYRDLVTEFPNRLALATPQKPLIVMLDALDQFSDLHNSRNLVWVPANLPANTSLIVSTTPGDCLSVIRRKLAPASLLQLEAMSADEGKALLTRWLEDAGRTLQPEQRDEVLSKFAGCSLPLYLKLAFEEARLWHSYDGVKSLGADVSSIMGDLFQRLSDEVNHGELMVSRALGYLQASRHGLTEDELLDVLSADEGVMRDFLRRSPRSPAVDRLPVVVWSRLYYDLEAYLTERNIDGATLLAFHHRQLGEAVAKDYLAGDKKREHHRGLVRYFEGQPLQVQEGGKKTPNVRKVSELPYHQVSAELWDELEVTLCDEVFIETKVAAGRAFELVDDFRRGLTTWPYGRTDAAKSLGRLGSRLARLVSSAGKEAPGRMIEAIAAREPVLAMGLGVRFGAPAAVIASIGLDALATGGLDEAARIFDVALRDDDEDAAAVFGQCWRALPRQMDDILLRLLTSQPHAKRRLDLMLWALRWGGAAAVTGVLAACLARADEWNDPLLLADIGTAAVLFAAPGTAATNVLDSLMALVPAITDAGKACDLLYKTGLAALINGVRIQNVHWSTQFLELGQERLHLPDACIAIPLCATVAAAHGDARKGLMLLAQLEQLAPGIRRYALKSRVTIALSVACWDAGLRLQSERLLTHFADLNPFDRSCCDLVLAGTQCAEPMTRIRANAFQRAVSGVDKLSTSGERLRFVHLAAKILARASNDDKRRLLRSLDPISREMDKVSRDTALCLQACAYAAGSKRRLEILRSVFTNTSAREAASTLSTLVSLDPLLAAESAQVAFRSAEPDVWHDPEVTVEDLTSFLRSVSQCDADSLDSILRGVNSTLTTLELDRTAVEHLVGAAAIVIASAGRPEETIHLWSRQVGLNAPHPDLRMPATQSRLIAALVARNDVDSAALLEERLLSDSISGTEDIATAIRACVWLANRIGGSIRDALAGIWPKWRPSLQDYVTRLAIAPLVTTLLQAGHDKQARLLAAEIVDHLAPGGEEHVELATILEPGLSEEASELWHTLLLENASKAPSGAARLRATVAAFRMIVRLPEAKKCSLIMTLFLNRVQKFSVYPSGAAAAATLAHVASDCKEIITIDQRTATWKDQLIMFAVGSKESPFEKSTRSEMFAIAARELVAVGVINQADELMRFAVDSLADASPLLGGFGAVLDAIRETELRDSWKSLGPHLAEQGRMLCHRLDDESVLGMAAQCVWLLGFPDLAAGLLGEIGFGTVRQAALADLISLALTRSPEAAAAWLLQLLGTDKASEAATGILRRSGLPENALLRRAVVQASLDSQEAIDELVAACLDLPGWSDSAIVELARELAA